MNVEREMLMGLLGFSYNALLINVQEILVEDVNPKKTGYVCGRTESGRLVNFEGEPSLVGQFVNVEITSARSSALFGVIKND